ncbi:hypothetical protein [Paludisphaera soli]|uniref:hypothetical protein n=1 Tax=Paludisphaera soli TaxID=2712865 RepID=UPI0013EA239B|nr:hypothetical protein [Paludisphaera soli]
MHLGSPLRRRLLGFLAAALALIPFLLATPGCGSPEEPSEVPASPPPGKGLPKFAEAASLPPRSLG